MQAIGIFHIKKLHFQIALNNEKLLSPLLRLDV